LGGVELVALEFVEVELELLVGAGVVEVVELGGTGEVEVEVDEVSFEL
jgi:hypothetical protein